MSLSSTANTGHIHVISRFGPIRIELLDHQLNRVAIDFGEMRKDLPAGLYLLQCSAGTVFQEEIIRIEPGSFLKREYEILFPAIAPISVSSTSHEFHTEAAVRYSSPLSTHKQYGQGGYIMIFVRTIDGDGRVPVPIERLSLWDAEMRQVADFAVEADRSQEEGWACLSAQVNPGGYALRWRNPNSTGEPQSIDQSIWIPEDWRTIVFIGYNSARGRLERQSASIHMTKPGMPFNPGPPRGAITADQVPAEELKTAKVNQALDLTLAGLRTGKLVVPDDLLNLLLEEKFHNPMLGIMGAHALLQQRAQDWLLFDTLVHHLHRLIPGHPDIAALEMTGRLMRNEKVGNEEGPLSWPPMVYTGYSSLIACDWQSGGMRAKVVREDSVAEQAAAWLLPESPWSCWQTLAARTEEPLGRVIRDLTFLIEESAPAKSYGHPVVSYCSALQHAISSPGLRQMLSTPAMQRLIRHLVILKELGEDLDLEDLTVGAFQQVGLPVATIERAVETLKQLLTLVNATALNLQTNRHPSSDEAIHFLAGQMQEANQAWVKGHIESGCAECRPLFSLNWLREHARTLAREGARLLWAPLHLPDSILAFATRNEPPELYHEQIETSDLVMVAEQDHDELLVRIRAADCETAFLSVYLAVLSTAGTWEALIPWETGHYWPAQHRFPDFNRLIASEDSVSILVSPIPQGAELSIKGDK